MGADKGKKLKVETEEDENGADLIDIELLQSVEKLQEIQEELEKVNEEASEKVLEVEQKYNEIRRPVYDKRNEVIKYIPDFWLTAFMSHPLLGGLVTEEDQKIFKYLADIEVEDCKDVKSGFTITFRFNTNPYFEDPKLTKTFSFLEEGTTKITATSIKWKDGMGIPNVISKEKKGKKRSHDEESFFTWFSESEHKGEGYDVRDQVAEIIKDELWSNPLTFFNNLHFAPEGADEEDEMDDDAEEGRDSGESDDDIDDDDDDSED